MATMHKNDFLMLAGARDKEVKLISLALFASIVLLFITVSYNRFLVYGSLYYPLFKMAWNPLLYPGDLIQNHIFLKSGCVFYAPIGWMSAAAGYLGKENFLFIIYLINNLAVLFVCYRTAMIYKSKALAMFFAVVLFTGWDLFVGASVSVVYPHHLSPTAFALPPALLALYSYIIKKYLPFFMCAALACLIHVKTGFAILAPLGICVLSDAVSSPQDRKRLMRDTALAAPILLFVIYIYFNAASGFKGDGEFIQAMLQQTRGESDFLTIGKLRFSYYNYIFLNLLSFYLYLRNRRYISTADRQIFKLIAASNAGMFLGLLVSICYRYVVPFAWLLCFTWPKIAFVSTYLCLLVIIRYIVFNKSFWENLSLLSMGFVLFFVAGSLLNVNVLLLRLMPKILIAIFLLFIIVYLSKRASKAVIKRVFFAIFILFIVSGQVYIQLREFQKKLSDRAKYKWDKTIYIMPFDFASSQYEYKAIAWLNNNAESDKMYIFPVIYDGRLVFEHSYRPHSDMPIFYTSDMDDVIGSSAKYRQWKQRRQILQEWLDTKNIGIHSKNNISYVITQKANKDILGISDKLYIYENKEIIIYKII